MKKVLFLFISALFLFSCSGDNNSESLNQFLNPPTWIQGTWGLHSEISGEVPMFKFTNDDFCTIVNGGSTLTCWDAMGNTHESITIEDTSTETSYNVSMTQAGSTTFYHFVRISDNEIQWMNSAAQNPILIKL